MSLRSKIPALVLLALAALPFAACGGNADPNAATCASYCQVGLACLDPKTCVLANPGGAQEACVSACETGLASLAPADATTVTACIACVVQAAGGKCLLGLPAGTCDAQCNSPTAEAAGKKFSSAFEAAPASPDGQCTNGMNALGGGSCSGGGDATSCTSSCCNGSSCTTGEVALQCTGASFDMCTCTAGKNKGKTFQSAEGCSTDVWTACNL